jgi:hypothetical protein
VQLKSLHVFVLTPNKYNYKKVIIGTVKTISRAKKLVESIYTNSDEAFYLAIERCSGWICSYSNKVELPR